MYSLFTIEAMQFQLKTVLEALREMGKANNCTVVIIKAIVELPGAKQS